MNNAQILANLDAAIKGITIQSTLGSSVLEPEQFDRFVRVLQHKTKILPLVRMQTMNAPIQDIDRIAFGDRVMKARPTEGTAVATSDFTTPTFDQHQLTAVGMRGVVGISDQVLRNNPEREMLMQTITDMMGERAGLDIEEQGIQGDTGSSDAFLALNDGWLKSTRRRVVEDALKAYDDASVASISTGVGVTTATVYYDNVPITGGTFEVYTTSTSGTLVADEDGDGVIDEVSSSGVTGTIDYNSGLVTLTGLTASTDYFVKYTAVAFDISASSGVLYPENMFDRMIQVVPKQYFTNPADWYIACPFAVYDGYSQILASRGTDLGDVYQTGPNGLPFIPYRHGVKVIYVPNMPSDRAWLFHPDNTLYGIFEQVELETEREAKAKRTDLILDASTDYAFEEPEASVVAEIA